MSHYLERSREAAFGQMEVMTRETGCAIRRGKEGILFKAWRRKEAEAV